MRIRWLVGFVALLAVVVVASVGGSAGELPTEPTRLRVRLLPRLKPTAGSAVFVRLDGPQVDDVRSLVMSSSRPGVRGLSAVQHLVVSDQQGIIRARQGRGRLHLQRRAQGWLELSYLIDSDESIHDVSVTPEGVRAVGNALLLLPDVAGQVHVDFAWDMRALPVQATASSFGFGRRTRTNATIRQLGESFYAAGPLTSFGNADARLVVWGKPSFDGDVVQRQTADLLETARGLFEPSAAAYHTVFLFAESDMESTQVGLGYRDSCAIWIDRARASDDRLALVIAHEIMHRWLGGTLRIRDGDGRDAAWFSEGFAVHYARTLALRAGTITPTQFAADVNRDLASQVQFFAGPQGKEASARAAYHQGALYAARVDGQLRQRGGSLDELVIELMRRDDPRHRSETDWRYLVAARLGPEASLDLDELAIVAQLPIELLPESFGPQFVLRGGRLIVRPEPS